MTQSEEGNFDYLFLLRRVVLHLVKHQRKMAIIVKQLRLFIYQFSRLLVVTAGLLIFFGQVSVWAEQTKLTSLINEVVGRNNSDDVWIMQRVQAFEKAYPDIEVEVIQGGEAGDLVDKLMVMTLGGTPPDLIYTYPSLIAEQVAEGIFLDLVPLMDKDPELSFNDFLGLEGLRWGSAVYGLPKSVSPIVGAFNRDMFSVAGLSTPKQLGPNWTWDTLVEYGRRLTKDINGDGIIDQWGLDISHDMMRWVIWSNQAGGNFFATTPDGVLSTTFNTPENITALRFFASLFIEHQIAGQRGLFRTGQAAITFDYNANARETFDAAGLQNYELTRLARGPKHDGTFMFIQHMSIHRDTKSVNEAWLLLKWLLADRQGIAENIKMTGRPPALRAAVSDYLRYIANQPDSIVFIEYAQDPNTRGEWTNRYAGTVRNINNRILGQVISGTMAPENALISIDQEARALIASGK
jgi:ABC-type glycerol-3-phosphate transport system substrate-binding protein